jgi:putative membrane protein
MTVAAILWGNTPLKLERSQLSLPLVVYLSNITFAAGLSLAYGFWIPVLLGVTIGVIPILILWWMAPRGKADTTLEEAKGISVAPVEVALK